MRHSKSLLAIPVALFAAVLLHACGGTDSGSGMPSTATVSGYVTDNLGTYESVVLTLNSVQLRHPSGRNCEIITGPLEIDAAELGRDEILEQVDTTTCEAGPYNRLFVELAEDVKLVGPPPGNTVSECKFVSYFDANQGAPNRLACANGICSLNITGAVNLIAGNHEHVALDVDLKNFVVDTNPTPCEVTLKVSPLHAADKLAAGFRKQISGTVSNLDVGADTFTLTVKGKPFTVQYAGVTDQTGLDALLERAATDGLRTSVRCQTIDLTTSPPTCTAQTDPDPAHSLKAITVKAEGTISLLNVGATTFTLSYGAGPTLLPVNYATADALGKVMGTLANGAVAEVKLFGSDVTSFFAREVEVE
jgi:hypothetical protein